MTHSERHTRTDKEAPVLYLHHSGQGKGWLMPPYFISDIGSYDGKRQDKRQRKPSPEGNGLYGCVCEKSFRTVGFLMPQNAAAAVRTQTILGQ